MTGLEEWKLPNNDITMEPVSKRPRRTAGTSFSTVRLFNTDSPIPSPEIDVQTFLSICLLNWNHYTSSEKHAIISTLPPAFRETVYDAGGNINCPVSPEFVAGDSVIKDQIARFKRDITEGFYTKTWQEKARKAMHERANGKFDEHLNRRAEEMFVDMAENVDRGSLGDIAVSSDQENGSRQAKK